MFSAGLLLALATLAIAQTSTPYGQCGGQGYTGATTCPSGWTCTYSNPYYSQCLQGSGGGGSSSTTTSKPTSTSPVSGGTSLNQLAKSKGKLYFGTATDVGSEQSDATYQSILTGGMFGQLTTANSMKWGSTEPQEGVYTYSNGDTIVNVAQSHNMVMRGHNLCWDGQLPSFITSSLSSSELVSLLQAHVTSEVTHYKGKIYSWDVVNEPFGDGGGMRSWTYQNVVGTSYINDAFASAHAADPNAKLYINDYGLEFTGAKLTTAVSTVKSLISQGVPINGIGFEGHMSATNMPSASSLAANMNQFTALGLEVAWTEIDVSITLPSTSAELSQQESAYQTMITACMMVEKCIGMTLWDFTDKYSWIPNGDPCPWDSNLQPKPAFTGIVNGLNS